MLKLVGLLVYFCRQGVVSCCLLGLVAIKKLGAGFQTFSAGLVRRTCFCAVLLSRIRPQICILYGKENNADE